MCYIVLLSTSSPEDLSAASTRLVHFTRDCPEPALAAALLYEHRWFVTGDGGTCSCGFRHLMDPTGLGFSRPQDWMKEEADDLEATAAFIACVRRLLADGHQVDCIDAWARAHAADLRTSVVDLATISDDEFRFFENHHFRFAARAPAPNGG